MAISSHLSLYIQSRTFHTFINYQCHIPSHPLTGFSKLFQLKEVNILSQFPSAASTLEWEGLHAATWMARTKVHGHWKKTRNSKPTFNDMAVEVGIFGRRWLSFLSLIPQTAPLFGMCLMLQVTTRFPLGLRAELFVVDPTNDITVWDMSCALYCSLFPLRSLGQTLRC